MKLKIYFWVKMIEQVTYFGECQFEECCSASIHADSDSAATIH